MAVAKLAHVPIEWLMNDAASVDDVWRLGSLSTAPASTARTNGAEVLPRHTFTDRATENFWRAVEYHVTTMEPHKQDAFGYEITPLPLKLVADFCFKKHLVKFCTNNISSCVYDDLGRILILERALHRPLNKTILVWAQTAPANLEPLTEILDATFAVKVVVVNNAQDAAAFLLSLN